MFINNYTTNKEIIKWKPSVIHETYYSKIITSNFNSPKILTVHDMIHENFMNQPEMISKNIKVLEDKKDNKSTTKEKKVTKAKTAKAE